MSDTKRTNKLPRLKKYKQHKTNFEKKTGRGYTKTPFNAAYYAKRKHRKQLSKSLAKQRRARTRKG